MKHFKQLLCITAVLCAGCGGGGGGGGDDPPPAAMTPPPAATPANFTTFVVAQYQPGATTETATPALVDGATFTFTDDNNPNAFDTVIATAP